MRIAVFTDSFLPGKGGTEQAVYNMCKALTEIEGNVVKVYCPQFHPKKKVDIAEFDVFRVPSFRLNASDMVALPSIFRQVYRDVEDFRPDVIHFCTVSGMAKAALKAGKRLGVPVVSTIHTDFEQAFMDAMPIKLVVYILMKQLAKRINASDKVSVVSRTQIPGLMKYGVYRNDIEIIGNGSNPRKCRLTEEEMEATKQRLGIKAGKILLSVGRLTKFKNIQFSLRALAAAKQKGLKDFQFIVAGTGNYAKKLKALTKRLKLENEVVFAGFVQDYELNALYKIADLMLFPTIADTYGLVIDDAARMGVPVMVLDKTAPSERIQNNFNGFVCKHDSALFGEKLMSILSDTALLNSVKAHLDTIQTRTWAMISQEYFALYNSAVKIKSPRMFAYRQPKSSRRHMYIKS